MISNIKKSQKNFLAMLLILVLASIFPFFLMADEKSGGGCGSAFDKDCDGVSARSCDGSTCRAYDLDDNDPNVGNFNDYVAGGGSLLP